MILFNKYQKKKYKFREKEIINFFKFLNKNYENYAVLGNLSRFPKKIDSDVDIYIDFKNINEIIKIVKNFALQQNLKISNIFFHEYNSIYFVLTKKVKNNYFNICIDVCNYYTYNGRDIINFSNLKKRKVKIKSTYYYTLSNHENLFYYFTKKILKGDINKVNFKFIKKNKKKLLLNKNFDLSQKKEILSVLRSKNYNIILRKTYLFKKTILKNKKFKIVNEINRIIDRFKHKTGYHISFLGIDGSGKSTQIIKFNNEFLNNCFRKITHYHLYNIKHKNDLKKNVPYNKSYGFILSFFKIIFLFFKFTKFYLIDIYLLKLKSTLIVSDRNHYDVMIDPLRYGITRHIFFLNYLFNLFPKPDLLFYLKPTIKSAYTRSNELSKKQIAINLKKYESFLKKKKDVIFINANKKIYDINIELNKIFYSSLNKKTLKIFNNSSYKKN